MGKKEEKEQTRERKKKAGLYHQTAKPGFWTDKPDCDSAVGASCHSIWVLRRQLPVAMPNELLTWEGWVLA